MRLPGHTPAGVFFPDQLPGPHLFGTSDLFSPEGHRRWSISNPTGRLHPKTASLGALRWLLNETAGAQRFRGILREDSRRPPWLYPGSRLLEPSTHSLAQKGRGGGKVLPQVDLQRGETHRSPRRITCPPRNRRTSAAESSEASSPPPARPAPPAPCCALQGARGPDGRPRQRPFLEGLKPSGGARAGERADDRCSRLAPQHFRATPVYKEDALFVS